MTASTLLAMATQYAMETDLSVDEARASRSYIEMLMARIEKQFSEDLQIGLRNGTADLEHRAD